MTTRPETISRPGEGVAADTPEIVPVRLGLGGHWCANLPSCGRFVNNFRERLFNKYIGAGKAFDDQIVSAWLDLRGRNYEEYKDAVRRSHKGSALRHARKSDRKGLVVQRFARETFIPDIVEIHHSKERRCGRPMDKHYLKSVEEMGGAPEELIHPASPACSAHADYYWGVFEPKEGHMQGKARVDKKLVAYINLRRCGNFALYSRIIGHGDYLRHGAMYRLHFAIVEWALDGANPHSRGLEHIIYAGYYQGVEGLRQWKRKVLFDKGLLVCDEPGDWTGGAVE